MVVLLSYIILIRCGPPPFLLSLNVGITRSKRWPPRIRPIYDGVGRLNYCGLLEADQHAAGAFEGRE